MWFDNNYGFKSPMGLQNWVKIAYFRKTISKGIGKYLIGYYGISETTMSNLVLSASSWLVQASKTGMGRMSLVRLAPNQIM